MSSSTSSSRSFTPIRITGSPLSSPAPTLIMRTEGLAQPPARPCVFALTLGPPSGIKRLGVLMDAGAETKPPAP